MRGSLEWIVNTTVTGCVVASDSTMSNEATDTVPTPLPSATWRAPLRTSEIVGLTGARTSGRRETSAACGGNWNTDSATGAPVGATLLLATPASLSVAVTTAVALLPLEKAELDSEEVSLWLVRSLRGAAKG